MSVFGDNLKRIRESRGLTQEKLAELLLTSKQVISRYENGQRSPKVSVVAEYSKKLGVSITDLSMSPSDNQIPSPVTFSRIPIIGAIRCGPGGAAYEDIEGYIDAANLKHPEECFYLRVTGDSMEPLIYDGDLALVRKQPTVESGELAAIVIDGEEGTLKRVRFVDSMIILEAFNPKYPPRVFMEKDIDSIRIIGRIIRTEKEW